MHNNIIVCNLYRSVRFSLKMAEQNGYLPPPKGFATIAIHHAQEPEQWDSMAVIPPIVTSTTFQQPMSLNSKHYQYARYNNPSRNLLEQVLAKLDNAKYGLAFSSGLAATTAIFGLLKSGDHMISGNDIYGGTINLFKEIAVPLGIEVSWVDLNDLSEIKKSIKTNTKLLWMETPTNPTMQIFDIKAVSEIAKQNNLIFVVDNTLLTSYFLRPLEFGADIVNYSLTKYVNGHLDVLMGAMVTSDEGYYKKLQRAQTLMGNVPSPIDCYLVNRGVKTLALRMKQHNKNALFVARYLENHPKVEKVVHPGLPSHPKHELFKTQSGGHSGTFAFYIKGSLETAKKFVTSLKIIPNAGSFGGHASIIELPCLISHKGLSKEHNEKFGITENLMRISIGLEEAEDIVADLEQAFNAV